MCIDQCSEISIIEKLPLEKNHTYLINFLRTGQVQNNFDCTVILTNDFRLKPIKYFFTTCCVMF